MAWCVAALAVALLATACLPAAPAAPPPPPPPPPLPAAPVGQAASGASVQYAADDSRVGDFPDPFVLRLPDGTYYAYSTGSLFTWATVQVMKSPDLVHWTYVGDAFTGPTNGSSSDSAPPPSAWADTAFTTWGPAVLRVANDEYVMYYAAKSKVKDSTYGLHCIGRATSTSPEGPFVDEEPKPLLCTPDRGGSIDPEPFATPDGSRYLLWKSEGVDGNEPTRLWSTRLSADGLTPGTDSTHHELLHTLAGSWEEPIVEGPSMMPAPGGGFLLFYSAARWETAGYKVGVAYCETPVSACTRIYSTPVLASRGTMVGPGGQHAFQDTDGNWMLAFASWTDPYVGYQTYYENGWPTPDERYARSFHLLPITFPAGGHNPKIG